MQPTQSLPLTPHAGNRRNLLDILFWLSIAIGTGYVWMKYGAAMDGYETGILFMTSAALGWLGYFWKPIRAYSALVTLLTLFAISLYAGQLARAETVFGLKYLLSSQSAILWMSVLFFMATGAYWLGLLARSDFAARTGSGMTWAAVAFGLTGMCVRWYESYLIAPDVGHIPVSNLYEVFVLFCVITGLMHLYYENRSGTRQFGAFSLLVISAAVGFLLWYSFERQAHEIQPLIPALQSYWMKIHVPANFVGYGAFALAAMLGIAILLAEPNPDLSLVQRRSLQITGCIILLAAVGMRFGLTMENIGFFSKGVGAIGALFLVAGNRGILRDRLPAVELLDDISYKAIAIGFAFFTVATILGALWAAEAWGGYWSWDPKETWALIVWLNYAAWLHMRLVKGLRGAILAWWSVVGLAVTTFAFLGVNMFLSGLHSYGSL